VTKAIWWVRRDLRLKDNQALNEAISSAQKVIPVFISDPNLVGSSRVSTKRMAFLYQGLAELGQDLRRKGSELILRQGQPADVLAQLVEESGATTVFAEADFSPYARQRDKRVSKSVSLKLVGGPSVSHPGAVLKNDGDPYVVYSPYMRAWKSLYELKSEQLLPAPNSISTLGGIGSDFVFDEQLMKVQLDFEPGERAAQETLAKFVESANADIFQYAESRNQLDLDGTGRISPYLRYGMISARECFVAAQEAISRASGNDQSKSAETWLNELIWREFFISILYHFPSVLRESFRKEYRDIRWQNDNEDFSAWKEGSTGYPVVDASIRQLLSSGWMHNRGRMITASFLVKDLAIDWRWGEKFFMQHLIDGDPAANNGGWQWTAGTGTDAAPYFRVFNPILQGKKFDPQGRFIKKWLPELSAVPEKYIHAPWEMPTADQVSSECIIGQDYPQPIVDHGFARDRILEIYKTARQTDGE
jgi:deoxyribodipyrimidine photo-lyase